MHHPAAVTGRLIVPSNGWLGELLKGDTTFGRDNSRNLQGNRGVTVHCAKKKKPTKIWYTDEPATCFEAWLKNSVLFSYRELRSFLHDFVTEHCWSYGSVLPSECVWWRIRSCAAGILHSGLDSVHPGPRYRTLTWSNEAAPISTSPKSTFFCCTFSGRRFRTAGRAAQAWCPFGSSGSRGAWKSSIDGQRHWYKGRGHPSGYPPLILIGVIPDCTSALTGYFKTRCLRIAFTHMWMKNSLISKLHCETKGHRRA